MEEAVERKHNKLLVLVGSPGVGKSATVRVLAKELELDVLSWNESYVSRGNDSFGSGLLSIEHSSAIDSFREFLQQTGTGFSSLDLSKNKGSPSTSNKKSIILLEELPNLHGPDAVQRFRGIMNQHLHRSQVPTVLIFSDVSEGKHKPDDLEQLVDPADLYSSFTCIRQMHPVTKTKMKKVMDRIAKVLKCKITPTMLEELHLQSGGDMRHAIMNLQLYSTGLKSVDASNNLQNNRDVKLSTFHALGKLLYAKRAEKNGRSVLMFEPDEIIERSDLGTGGSLRFLEYHSADFFTDSIELSNAFELYSDAAVLLDHPDVR
jgi:cell cycle checkpoint protein